MNFLMSIRMMMTYHKTKRLGGIVLDILKIFFQSREAQSR